MIIILFCNKIKVEVNIICFCSRSLLLTWLSLDEWLVSPFWDSYPPSKLCVWNVVAYHHIHT